MLSGIKHSEQNRSLEYYRDACGVRFLRVSDFEKGTSVEYALSDESLIALFKMCLDTVSAATIGKIFKGNLKEEV